MPALMRPRSATARLSWSSSRPASPSSKPAQRPASARYLPRGRTTKTELDKLLEEEEQADRPPQPPKPVDDAEKMEQQRSEWMAKDAAFRRAAAEKDRQGKREQQRISSALQHEAEQTKTKAAVDTVDAADAEHRNAVQTQFRRFGLAGDGKAKARLRSKATEICEDARSLTQAEVQHRDTLKVLSSFHTGTYDEIERQVDRNFDKFNDIATSAPSALGDVARGLPVTDADFDLGLENAKHGVGDQMHADMFVKLHELWASTRDEIPTNDSKEENIRVRAMVVARFRRYQQTWPKSEKDLEAITIAQYTAGKKQKRAAKRRRPQSGPARPTAEQQQSADSASRRPTKESRPASGPARVGWSAEADAHVARIGLFPPLGRPPSAQPIQSAGQWAQQLYRQEHTRPMSAPARLAATVVARWSHHTLGYALRGWRDAAAWRAAARARLRYCVNRMLDDRLYRSIDRWREQASLQKRAKQLLRRTLVTWNNRSLAFAFNSWKEYMAAAANRYGGILAMWKGDGRRMYFNTWKNAVALIKEQKPASHEFFQSLCVATFRGIETVPAVWKVGQAALHSDSDDSSDSAGERDIEPPNARNIRKKSKARKKKQQQAPEQGQSVREFPRGPGRRGLNKRLMRYYDGSSNVNRGTDRTMGDQCSAAACPQDAPLAWSQLEVSAVNSRPARVPTTQALTHEPPVEPSPHDIVTAALEGRLRNHHDSAGIHLGYLGPVAVGKKLPRNVYDKEIERDTVLSEKPEPEREVELRANELYGKTDELGRLHFEGQYISHAYRPSVSRANNRRGAVSNRVIESCMDAAAAAAAAVAALAVEVRTGVSADQATAARARKQRLAKEREYGWQIAAEKLDKTRLITNPKRRGGGLAVDKKKHPSLWHSTRAASTSVCVIC